MAGVRSGTTIEPCVDTPQRSGGPRACRRDTDQFHQALEHDLRCLWSAIDGYPAHGVSTGWITAVGPVEDAMLEIELEIDGLRQLIQEFLDVGARSSIAKLHAGRIVETPLENVS